MPERQVLRGSASKNEQIDLNSVYSGQTYKSKAVSIIFIDFRKYSNFSSKRHHEEVGTIGGRMSFAASLN